MARASKRTTSRGRGNNIEAKHDATRSTAQPTSSSRSNNVKRELLDEAATLQTIYLHLVAGNGIAARLQRGQGYPLLFVN